MLKVEVKNGDAIVKEGKFDDGRAWQSRQQEAWVFLMGQPYPSRIMVKLGRAEAYQPGVYFIHPESVRVYRDRLEFAKYIRLLPAKEASDAFKAAAGM